MPRWSRLALGAALVILAVVVGRMANSRPVPDSDPVAVTVVVSPTGVEPLESPSPPEASSPTGPAPRAALDPKQTARQWVAAWLDIRDGRQAWLARLRPMTLPTFLDALSTTDPANMPRGKVLPGVTVTDLARGAALVFVRTSFGTVTVEEALMNRRWVVTSITKVKP